MNDNSIEFRGKAGGYFVVFLVATVAMNIPLFGWPLGLNYGCKWLLENLYVDGRQGQYNAKYGETLKFLFVSVLLLMITLGIYVFWFVPKLYRFIASHSSFGSASTATTPSMSATQAPTQPTAPTQSAGPTTGVIGAN